MIVSGTDSQNLALVAGFSFYLVFHSYLIDTVFYGGV